MTMQRIQAAKLQPWMDEHDVRISWHQSIDDIPTDDDAYTMLVAHEFFDALPIYYIQVSAFSKVF